MPKYIWQIFCHGYNKNVNKSKQNKTKQQTKQQTNNKNKTTNNNFELTLKDQN